MAKKRSNEHPKVLLERRPEGWRPVTGYDAERLSQYAIGAVVEAQLWQNRSLEHLRLYWVILHQCVENSENKYGRAEDLHDAIKIALGYTRTVKMLAVGPGAVAVKRLTQNMNRIGVFIQKIEPRVPAAWRQPINDLFNATAELVESLYQHIGDTIIMPGSIALDKMDQAEFRVYFDRAMNELRKAGYPVDDFLAEGQKQIARNKAGNPYQTKQQQEITDGGREAAPRTDSGAETETERAQAA
jgi:hypothetical protein